MKCNWPWLIIWTRRMVIALEMTTIHIVKVFNGFQLDGIIFFVCRTKSSISDKWQTSMCTNKFLSATKSEMTRFCSVDTPFRIIFILEKQKKERSLQLYPALKFRRSISNIDSRNAMRFVCRFSNDEQSTNFPTDFICIPNWHVCHGASICYGVFPMRSN